MQAMQKKVDSLEQEVRSAAGLVMSTGSDVGRYPHFYHGFEAFEAILLSRTRDFHPISYWTPDCIHSSEVDAQRYTELTSILSIHEPEPD